MADEARPSIREAVAASLSNLSDRTRSQGVLMAVWKAKEVVDQLENERRRIKPNYQGFDAGQTVTIPVSKQPTSDLITYLSYGLGMVQ